MLYCWLTLLEQHSMAVVQWKSFKMYKPVENQLQQEQGGIMQHVIHEPLKNI